MRILLTGLNHRTAPLAVRGRLSVTRSQLPGALEALQEQVGSGVILSTCNRTEVYTVVRDGRQGQASLGGFLQAQFGVSLTELQPYLYTLEQWEAVEHLYRVASSLDSLIIGESQILGQVRDAYGVAVAQGSAQGVLSRVFHEALRVGRRVRRETTIGHNALSISRACVEVARRVLGDLGERRALMVGVGEASKLAARALRDGGLRHLMVINRTIEHAEEMAREMNGTVASLDGLQDLLQEADIVVTSTGSPGFLVGESLVRGVMASRPDRPLFVIDMAVPPDVDPAVGRVPGVHRYDIDQLEMVAEANRQEREAEAVKAGRIIEEEVERFQVWWDSQEVAPTIAALRSRADALREAELERTLRRLPHLSQGERRRVEAMSKALVKKLLHDPTQLLRGRNDRAYTQVARDLFGLSLDAGSPTSDGTQASASPRHSSKDGDPAPTLDRRKRAVDEPKGRRG